jgi:hypothetical protein
MRQYYYMAILITLVRKFILRNKIIFKGTVVTGKRVTINNYDRAA